MPRACAGFRGDRANPSAILLTHHGLHVELCIDRNHHIGRDDPAGLSNVLLESAITTIQDCEDSVAAVSAADKVIVYRNWLGLMRGTLECSFDKGGRSVVRKLSPPDRRYLTPAGSELVLPGRSLMLVRNVGHHMLPNAITSDGAPIPETFIDAAVTSLIALHDLAGPAARLDSRAGSIYIVKPKMHGPEEAAFAAELFAAVEDLFAIAAQYPEGRRDGRGAQDHRQSRRMHPRGARSAWCSSIPAFWIAPAMRSTPPWRPRPFPARQTSRRPCGWTLTSGTTWTWASRAVCRDARKSARACGRCRI